ncbi:hypothetical protein N9514_04530, partial [Pseudomonadales bacterium]|nr:hypothetical protein [Pseudomonadales bacterium]
MFSCKCFAVLVCITVLIANTTFANTTFAAEPESESESEAKYLVRFLWDDTERPKKSDEDKGARNILAEGDTAKMIADSVVAAAAGPVMARSVTDTSAEVMLPVLVVARDLALLKLQLDGLHVSVTEEFTELNMVVVSLNQRQIQVLKSHANVLSISANRDLRTAALIYSVKGAPALDVTGRQVSWEILNLGKRKLNLSQLTLSWPEANGALEKILWDGKPIAIDELLEGAVIEATGRLKPKKAAVLTLEFSSPAVDLPDDYAIAVEFDEGLMIEYASQSNLPMQGRRRDTFFPSLVDADLLHVQGITGKGVGVAIIDTGSWSN